VRVLAVVPALNEEKALPALLAELREAFVGLGVRGETVVIDDGSTDGTAAAAVRGGARIVRLARNLGIGGAVQTGLKLAAREGFDCAVQIDGDGQHPPAELSKLLAPLTAASGAPPDLVVGSRYRDKVGFTSTHMRRLGSRFLRALLRAVTGLRTSDPTSGFRVYGPRALRLYSETYPYDYPEPESLAVAKASGLEIVEVSVNMRERQGGSSSIAGLRAPYYMVKVTVAVVLAYLRNRRRNVSR
jgi:glycosyltransferase involved in cell wall biosynthesis